MQVQHLRCAGSLDDYAGQRHAVEPEVRLGALLSAGTGVFAFAKQLPVRAVQVGGESLSG